MQSPALPVAARARVTTGSGSFELTFERGCVVDRCVLLTTDVVRTPTETVHADVVDVTAREVLFHGARDVIRALVCEHQTRVLAVAQAHQNDRAIGFDLTLETLLHLLDLCWV